MNDAIIRVLTIYRPGISRRVKVKLLKYRFSLVYTIIIIGKQRDLFQRRGFAPWRLVFYLCIIPFLAIGIFFCVYFLNRISKQYRIPIIFYTFIILCMSFSALLRIWYSDLASWIIVLCGSLCFLASDFILFINTFIKKIYKGMFWWPATIKIHSWRQLKIMF